MEQQVLGVIATVFLAGFVCYVAVRVGQAELRGDVKRLDEKVNVVIGQIARLERPLFDRRDDPS